MFDMNSVPIPLISELAPLECAYLLDQLVDDLFSLENRPYEITLSAHCFDNLPRTWSFTPMSEQDAEVFGENMHRVTVDIRNVFGEYSVSTGQATLQRVSGEGEWNDDDAVEAIANGIMTAWVKAVKAYLEYIFPLVGFDQELFLEQTEGRISDAEIQFVLMSWGVLYEMQTLFTDPALRESVSANMFADMKETFDRVKDYVHDYHVRVVDKAKFVDISRMLNDKDGV